MEITQSVLDNGVKYIALEGRLDVPGAAQIELKFTAYTATEKAAVVVDLSQVTFLASIGMRLLLANARAAEGRGGKMVLLNPAPLVGEALKLSGISTLVPVYSGLDEACQAALNGLQA